MSRGWRKLCVRLDGRSDPEMSKATLDPTPTNADSVQLRHDPVSFWGQVGADGDRCSEVEVLRLRNKSAVYRLIGAGPNSEPVIAKRCRRRIARLEQFIYQEFLPPLAVPSLRCYGRVEEAKTEFDWLFLEQAGGTEYSPLNAQHRALAGRWLGTIHSAAVKHSLAVRLPARGPDHYLKLLRLTRDQLCEHEANPRWQAAAVLLRSLVSQCDSIEARWSQVEGYCLPAPRGLVHGDFVVKNLRVQNTDAGPTLLAYDWENAGWGVPAGDLASCSSREADPNLAAYRASLGPNGAGVSIAVLEKLVACGRIFRMLDCMQWAARAPAISCLTVYEPWVAESLRAFR